MPSGALPCGCRKLWCWSSNMFWLVVYLPLWKMMEWKSVGMIVPFTTVSGKSFKIPWFQSTNQHSLTIVISTNIYHKPQNSAIYRFQSPPTSVPGWIDSPSPFTSPRSTRSTRSGRGQVWMAMFQGAAAPGDNLSEVSLWPTWTIDLSTIQPSYWS